MTAPPVYTDRLPGVLPDFTRRIWTSDEARAVWEPRLQAIGAAWAELERISVAVYQREAALTMLAPDAVPAASTWAARNGTSLLILGQQGAGGEYSSTSQPVVAGQSWQYRAAYVYVDSARAFDAAWRAGDDGALGVLLGYPACCRRFFQEVWVAQRCVDTTWAMAGQGDVVGPEAQTIHVHDTLPQNNILLRWLGVRAVPHLPCSFCCAETLQQADRFLGLGRARFPQETAWAEEMLGWPVEWTALHGIAEIKTPIVKISARTDLTRSKYVVQRHSDTYPAEGARGVRFPYRTPQEQRALVTLQPRVVPAAAHNGFASAEARATAHDTLVAAADTISREHWRGEPPVLLDLGAGNGELLTRLGALFDTTRCYGVERDPARASATSPDVTLAVGDFLLQPQLWPGPYTLAVVMPGRLLEIGTALASRTLDLLADRAQWVLWYAYGDWLGADGLRGLLGRLGLFVTGDQILVGSGVEAVVLPAGLRTLPGTNYKSDLVKLGGRESHLAPDPS